MFTPASRAVLGLGLLGLASAALAGGEPFDSGWKSGSCAGLPNHHQLQTALENARGQSNGGFDLDMWATVVNRDGVVCEVAFTGHEPRFAMARQPGHFGAEGQHRQCLQPARARAVHRQSVCRGATRRLALRSAAQQPGRYGRGLSRARRRTSARMMTRWTGAGSVA